MWGREPLYQLEDLFFEVAGPVVLLYEPLGLSLLT